MQNATRSHIRFKANYFQSRFIFVSVRRREKELNKLYEKIAREFPFLVQQGLYTPRGEKVRTYKLEDYYKRPIHLHLIFEKSSWKNQVR